MKVSKENAQKIFLAVMVAVGGLYYYCFELVGPLNVKEKRLRGELSGLESKATDARGKISKERAIASSDPNAEQAGKAFEVMQHKIPSGQPIAWLPTRLGEFFKSQGIAKQTYRAEGLPQNSDLELPGYQLSVWTVEFPGVSFALFGKALAGFETQNGLAQISNFQITAVAKEPDSHRAQLTFSTLVKSEK